MGNLQTSEGGKNVSKGGLKSGGRSKMRLLGAKKGGKVEDWTNILPEENEPEKGSAPMDEQFLDVGGLTKDNYIMGSDSSVAESPTGFDETSSIKANQNELPNKSVSSDLSPISPNIDHSKKDVLSPADEDFHSFHEVFQPLNIFKLNEHRARVDQDKASKLNKLGVKATSQISLEGDGTGFSTGVLEMSDDGHVTGEAIQNVFLETASDESHPVYKRHMSVPLDVSSLSESCSLQKAPSLSRAELEARLQRPQFVPEKLDFRLYEKFEGFMLINWYLSELSSDSPARKQLGNHELKLLASQFCTHLLAAGVLKQLPDPGVPPTNIFRPDCIYFWSHAQVPQSQPQTPGKLGTLFWPPTSDVPISPKDVESDSDSRKHRDVKSSARDAEMLSLEDEIKCLRQEVEKYKTLIEIQNLTASAVNDFGSPTEQKTDNEDSSVLSNGFRSGILTCDVAVSAVLNRIEKSTQTTLLVQDVETQTENESRCGISTQTETTTSPTKISPGSVDTESVSTLVPSSANSATLSSLQSASPVPPPPPPPPPPSFSPSSKPPLPQYGPTPSCSLSIPQTGTIPAPPPLPQSTAIPPPPPFPLSQPGTMPPPPPPPLPIPRNLAAQTLPDSAHLPCSGPPLPPPMPGAGGVVRPPPPPPVGPLPMPPPPIGGFNPQKSATKKPPINPPVPMKPLYWTRILVAQASKPDDSPALWEEIEEIPITSLQEDFMKLFSRQIMTRTPTIKKEEVKPKVEVVKLLDSKRSQNVGILAQSLRQDFHEIENAIYSFDTSVVSLEALQQIYEVRATEEELSLIKEHLKTRPDVPLDKPEQFLYDLSQIDDFAERITCLTFQVEFEDAVTTISHTFDNFRSTCEFLTKNPDLKRVLALILTLGNYMNGGNVARGQADGFGLEVLSRLKDVKAAQAGLTLLHFVVGSYVRNGLEGDHIPPLPVPEPGDVRRAMALDFDQLKGELNRLKKKLSECEKKTEKIISNSTPENLQPFKEKMEMFLEKSSSQFETECENLEDCHKMFVAMMKVYLFKPKHGTLEAFPPAGFFELWLPFCVDFKDIYKKEILKLQMERTQEMKRKLCHEANVTKERENGLKAKFKKARARLNEKQIQE